MYASGFIFVAMFSWSTVLGVKVVINQGTGYALIQPQTDKETRSWTICFRTRPERFNNGYILGLPFDIYNFKLLDPAYTFFRVQNAGYMVKANFKLFQWNSVCAMYDYRSMKINIHVNGALSQYTVSALDGHKPLTPILIINMTLAAVHLGERPMIGRLGDVHIWDNVISTQSIRNYESCVPSVQGNILDWNKASLTLYDTVVEEVDLPLLCTPNIPGLTLLPERLNYDNAMNLCERLGGEFPAFKKSNDKQNVIQQYNETDSCKSTAYIWSAFTDLKTEGKFVDKTGDILDKNDYNRGEPNGGEFENCGSIHYTNGKHVDIGCWEALCGACNLDHLPQFKLRGLLPVQYDYDRTYYWTRALQNGKYVFEGIIKNKLVANKDGHWTIIDVNNGTVLLELQNHNYPMGRYSWQDKVKNNTFILSFDGCNDNQFNCGTGNCIMMTQRCNEKKDCPDNSDEENCASIKLPPDYNLGVPPLGSADNGELTIQISKFSLDIDDILDVDGLMDTQFGIVSIWKDSRLTYINLNNNGPSVITEKEKKLIWLPSYTIWKADSKGLQEEFGFQTLSAYALQNGTISDKNNDVAYSGYPGDNTSLEYRQWFKTKVICKNAHLHLFPFDENTCDFKVSLYGTLQSWDIKTNKPNIKFNISFELKKPNETIKMYVVDEMTSEISDFGQIQISVFLRRTFVGIFLQNALPNMLLSIVVFSSNLYYNERFEAAIAVNVTCLLAMSGFFIAIFQSLPKTPRIKIIDMLQIKSISLATATTLLQTFDVQNSFWRPNKRLENINNWINYILDLLIFWIIPISGIALDVLFVVVGVMYDFKIFSTKDGFNF